MFVKLFALIAAFCLVQGETVHDVMQEYRPLIREFGMKIGTAAKESGMEMAATNAKMNAHAEEAWKTVHGHMMEMKMMVDEAIKEAEHKGKDIKHCVEKIHEEMHGMDMDAMKKCYPAEEMMVVKKAMESMNRMQGMVNRIPTECVRKFPLDSQTDELRKCMDDGMHDMEEGMMHEQMTVTKGLGNASMMHEKCVNNTMKTMMKAMDKMSKDFKTCVRKA